MQQGHAPWTERIVVAIPPNLECILFRVASRTDWVGFISAVVKLSAPMAVV
jgi:hypothetical protein